MNESEALGRMVAPGDRRPGKYMQGVIQIWVTRACDKACFGCTQGSNLGGKNGYITVQQFEDACKSLKGYFGVVGMFGGNPAMHPDFAQLCEVMREHVPAVQRGIWCNNPLTFAKAAEMRKTFNPAYSNLNVHLDRDAYELFRKGWPESRPFGLKDDSRHSPPYVAMKDVVTDEGERWRLISDCDINKHWSAMIGVFRGELRAWFCEIAGAQAMLHQHEDDYPATGLDPNREYGVGIDGYGKSTRWWELPMSCFSNQVRKHCHDCGIPLRSAGSLSQDTNGTEQVSETHRGVYTPRKIGRRVELVTVASQLESGRIRSVIDYLGNAKR